MTQIALLVAVAALALGINRLTRIPSVPLLVLGGVLLSVFGAAGEPAMLRDFLVLGLAFLVFVMGADLHPERVGRQGRAALIIGTLQFLALAGVGFLATVLLGFRGNDVLYLSLALAASSTLVVVNLLRQQQQMFEPFGRLVLGVLLLQDLLIVLLLSALSRADAGAAGAAQGLGSALLLVALAYFGMRWAVPWLLLRTNLDEEGQLLSAVAMLFLFAGLAHLLGLPIIVGAFLGGITLSSFPVSGVVRGQLSSLSDFFLAVFFVALGASLTLPGGRDLVAVGVLGLLVVVVTPPLVTVLARWAGQTARTGIEGGLFLAQCSEFSLIVAILGAESGHTSPEILSIIALVTVLTMILTPFLATDTLTWRLMHLYPSPHARAPVPGPSGHVLLVGCSKVGTDLLPRLTAEGRRVVVVDEDPAVLEKIQGRFPVTALRGDGADHRTLTAAGARSAAVIISMMRRVEDNERLLRFAGGRPVLVRVFGPEEAGRIEALGGRPVVFSAAAADSFLRWYEEHRDTGGLHPDLQAT